MDLTTFLTIWAVVGPLLSGAISAVVGWYRLRAERKKSSAETQNLIADTQSQVLEDLNKQYLRVCDELVQTQMGLKACEAENEICRAKVQELQAAVGLLQGQSRLFLLARARAHLAIKTLGSYELHIDYLLDEMRSHNVPITPMMRTQAIRTAYQIATEKLETMEAQELEVLLRHQITEESPTK